MTERWLDHLFDTTPGVGDVHRVIIVAGGVPELLRERWSSRFGDRVEFVFPDEYVNQAVVRNTGLRMAETELAVLADNDAYPRPGWLEAMARCHHETGAVMVSPLILQKPTEIHCAGTDLYINVRDGREYGHKHLRYYQMPYCDGSNLSRERIDYGELHFQSVEVAATLEVEAFDEAITEVGEVDSGLSWAKGGREMFFEPEAVVHFQLRGPMEPVDVPFFDWRWDFDRVAAGYQHFARKWGFDVSEEGGFDRMLLDYNAFVGHLARRYPSRATLRAGWVAKRIADGIAQTPRRVRIDYRQRVTSTKHRRLSG